jgi:outer membrane protein
MKSIFLTGSCIFFMLAGTRAQNDSITWDLSQCIQYAIENNLTVKQAELNKATSEVNYQQSRHVFLPGISATASKDFNSNGNSTSLSAGATIDFYTGGQQVNNIRQDKLIVQQNDLYVQEAKNNITLSLTQAYIQALYYREGMVIAKNNLDASQKQYIQAKAKYDIGSLAAKGLADVASQVANNEYQLVAAKNNFAQQVLKLKQLLELAPGQLFDIVIPEVNGDSLLIADKMDIYQKALSIMPEIESQNLQVSVNELGLKIARSGYYPTLSLNGGLSTGQNSNSVATFSSQ